MLFDSFPPPPDPPSRVDGKSRLRAKPHHVGLFHRDLHLERLQGWTVVLRETIRALTAELLQRLLRSLLLQRHALQLHAPRHQGRQRGCDLFLVLFCVGKNEKNEKKNGRRPRVVAARSVGGREGEGSERVVSEVEQRGRDSEMG